MIISLLLTGALFVHKLGTESSSPLLPIFYGGGQERNYRPGTENTGMIAGLGEACRLVTENLYQYMDHMQKVKIQYHFEAIVYPNFF